MVFHLWDHAARMEANPLDPEAPSLFTAQIADDGFCYVSQNHLITASWGHLLPIHICFPAHGHDIKITDCIFDVMTMSREAYMDREKIAPGSSDEMVLRHIAKSIIRNLGREKARGFRVQRVGLHTGSVIPKVENHIKKLLK